MVILLTYLQEKDFGHWYKTFLFENPTLDSVSTYVLRRYPEQLRRVLGMEEAVVTTLPQSTRGKIVASATSSQIALLKPGRDPHHRLALLRKGTNPFLATVSVADEHARQDKWSGWVISPSSG